MSDTTGDAAPSMELVDIRTSVDAGAWLRNRAAAFADAEANATSPIDAKALRWASETIGVLAELLPTVDAMTAATMLNDMAREYGRPLGKHVARQDPAHWRACLYLAETYGVIGAQLAATTRERCSLHGQQADRDLGRQL